MKRIVFIVFIVILISTCKKDEAIFETQNAEVSAQTGIDTSFKHTVIPNPCHNILNLYLYFPRPSPVKIQFFDILGRAMISPVMVANLNVGYDTIQFDLSSFNTGQYILICTYDKGTLANKVVKQ